MLAGTRNLMYKSNKQMDEEANQFAIELLMPRDWVLADLIEMQNFDIETEPRLILLAKRYQVSLQLMTIRVYQVLSYYKKL